MEGKKGPAKVAARAVQAGTWKADANEQVVLSLQYGRRKWQLQSKQRRLTGSFDALRWVKILPTEKKTSLRVILSLLAKPVLRVSMDGRWEEPAKDFTRGQMEATAEISLLVHSKARPSLNRLLLAEAAILDAGTPAKPHRSLCLTRPGQTPTARPLASQFRFVV